MLRFFLIVPSLVIFYSFLVGTVGLVGTGGFSSGEKAEFPVLQTNSSKRNKQNKNVCHPTVKDVAQTDVHGPSM